MTGRKREAVAELELSAEEVETLSRALEGSDDPAVDLIQLDLAAANAALVEENFGRRGGRL